MDTSRTAQIEQRLAEIGEARTREQVDLLVEMAWEIALAEPERSDALTEAAAKLAKELDYHRGGVYARRNRAYQAMIRGQLEDAMRLARSVIEEFSALGDKQGLATAADVMSNAHKWVGAYDDALRFADKALGLHRETGNRRGEAWALVNIGEVFAIGGEIEAATQRYDAGAAIFEEAGYEGGLSRVETLRGELCERQGDLAGARQHHQRAVALATSDGTIAIGVAISLMSLGDLDRRLGDADSAKTRTQAALEWAYKSNNPETVAQVLLTMGLNQLELGELEAARSTLRRVLDGDAAARTLPLIVRVHEALSRTYEALGDYPAALEQARGYQRSQEKLFGEESNRKLRNLRVRMEVERLDKEAEIHRLRYVELAEMQSKLIETEKMALLGKLVAGIAHEVNNPLGVIQSNASLTERATEHLEAAVTEAGVAEVLSGDRRWTRAVKALRDQRRTTGEAATRISRLVTSLKSLSGLDQAAVQDIDLNARIEEALLLVEGQLPVGGRVERDLGVLPRIRAESSALAQVLATLLQNAAEAIDQNGVVRISTRHEGEVVHVEVADTGRGMSTEELDRLFEIGFSRNSTRVRMRVGLANARAVVQRHGGAIEVTSAAGEGTLFRLTLRLSGPPVSGGRERSMVLA